MKANELRRDFRIHQRSISQMIEEMDRASQSSIGGRINYGMSSDSTSNIDATDELASNCFGNDQLSPESEYDETLAFPDDSLTLVSVGKNSVLVQKQDRKESVDGNDSSSSEEEDNKSVRRTYNEVPYENIYKPPVKFHSYDRDIFIPGTQIHVAITHFERSMTAHLFNPILYTIQLTHGNFIWTIKKRYKDFSFLHSQLGIFRTSLNFPLPSRTHREIRSSFRNNHKISVSTISNSNLNGSNPMIANKQKRKTKRKKGSLPRFPKRPDTLIGTDQIPARIKQLENYLYNLLSISLYRNHYDTINFLEVSNFSFISALGEKGRETMIKKRTGSTNPGHKKCNFLNCLALGCCIRCNYLCSDLICGQWQQRWLIVKDTFLVLQNPKNGLVRGVILLDSGFDISMGLYSTGLNSGLQVVTNSKHIVLKFSSKKIAKEWGHYLKAVGNSSARDFTSPNPFNSFAPTRPSTLSGVFVDGSGYMAAVADSLEGATEDIFIADWWLSPEIYMKRPSIDGDYWRLDKILLRKAKQGVKIFILLYKEVEMALGINSYYSKQKLAQLHENIKLLRHPDHVRVGIFFWAHHEKLVVIDQTYAFVGGIDLCYGRWDDHLHRLSDLGSISTSNKSPSIKSFTIVENPIRSLIMQSKGILHATASHSTDVPSSPTQIKTNLTAIEETPENEQIDERTKRDTPEMKRRGLTEKIKENVKNTGREIINKLTLHGEGSDDEAKVQVKPEPAPPSPEPEPPSHVELNGQAKFWIGKDYCNFILKDFTELNQPFADMIDRSKTPRMPWHDISAVVIGHAARDVARHFIERWNACKLEKARDNLSYPYLMPKTYSDIRIDQNFFSKVRLDRVTTQVLRSASDWSTGFVENDTYEESIHEAYVETITKAQHYIYIENQFFISLGFPDTVVKNQIAESLYKRIIRAYREKKVFRVFIILPLLPGFEGDVAGTSGNALRLITHWNYASICRADNSIIARLLKAGIRNPSDYISFHSLRNHSTLDSCPITELIYVHSKLLIADDKTVIIGSANINDRSLLGKRDSEVAVIINDEAFEDGKMNGESFPCGVYAGRLRKNLFKEHLGLMNSTSKTDPDITDPIIASFYKDVWLKTSKENTKLYDEVFKCLPNDNVRNFITLRKYNDEPAMCKSKVEEAEEKVKAIKGFLVDLPLNFLCDEILTPSNLSREGIVGMTLWT